MSPESPGGQERGPRAGALDEGVGRQRGAVDEHADVRRGRRAPREDPIEGFEHARLRRAGRGRDLGGVAPGRSVEDDVGERSPDIGRETVVALHVVIRCLHRPVIVASCRLPPEFLQENRRYEKRRPSPVTKRAPTTASPMHTPTHTLETCLALDGSDPLAGFADRFARSASGSIHFDANSMGAMPVDVPDRIRRVLTEGWRDKSRRAWTTEGWVERPARARQRHRPRCRRAPRRRDRVRQHLRQTCSRP